MESNSLKDLTTSSVNDSSPRIHADRTSANSSATFIIMTLSYFFMNVDSCLTISGQFHYTDCKKLYMRSLFVKSRMIDFGCMKKESSIYLSHLLGVGHPANRCSLERKRIILRCELGKHRGSFLKVFKVVPTSNSPINVLITNRPQLVVRLLFHLLL
jgi:hypothetical protein